MEKLLSVPPSNLFRMFSRVIFQQDVSIGSGSACEVATQFASLGIQSPSMKGFMKLK